MDYENITNKLIARICAYFSENKLYNLGQVRATKLVYLIECEYFGWERRQITNLDWIFYHYGPWSPTLDKILKEDFKTPAEQEPEAGKFRPVAWTPPSFDMPKLKFDVTVEGILGRILDRFATMPYPELLDYVYFETEPMISAVKRQKLDFSCISRREAFVDPASLLQSSKFYELKKRFDSLELEPADIEIEILQKEEMENLLLMMDDGGIINLKDGGIVLL